MFSTTPTMRPPMIAPGIESSPQRRLVPDDEQTLPAGGQARPQRDGRHHLGGRGSPDEPPQNHAREDEAEGDQAPQPPRTGTPRRPPPPHAAPRRHEARDHHEL